MQGDGHIRVIFFNLTIDEQVRGYDILYFESWKKNFFKVMELFFCSVSSNTG